MAGDPSPQRPRNDDEAGKGANQGYLALSYLIGGIAVWGLIGWLIDRWLDTGGVATGLGVILGAAGGIYLLVRRMGA
jgi:F0F1-type ATP synthase assembly protein I